MKKYILTPLLFCTVALFISQCNQSQPVSNDNPGGTDGSAVVYLPQIPDGFLAKTFGSNAIGELTLTITGPNMEPMIYSWPTNEIPTEPVTISGIPAGKGRVFSGQLINSTGTLSHEGSSVVDIFAGKTVRVHLYLERVKGDAIVTIEIEGLEPELPSMEGCWNISLIDADKDGFKGQMNLTKYKNQYVIGQIRIDGLLLDIRKAYAEDEKFHINASSAHGSHIYFLGSYNENEIYDATCAIKRISDEDQKYLHSTLNIGDATLRGFRTEKCFPLTLHGCFTGYFGQGLLTFNITLDNNITPEITGVLTTTGPLIDTFNIYKGYYTEEGSFSFVADKRAHANGIIVIDGTMDPLGRVIKAQYHTSFKHLHQIIPPDGPVEQMRKLPSCPTTPPPPPACPGDKPLSLLLPKDGSVFYHNYEKPVDTMVIKWCPTKEVSLLVLQLSIDGGLTYQTIIDKPFDSRMNVFLFPVPGYIDIDGKKIPINSKNCILKISDYNDDTIHDLKKIAILPIPNK